MTATLVCMDTSGPGPVCTWPTSFFRKAHTVQAVIAALFVLFAAVPGIASVLGTDLNGKPITSLAPTGSKAVVLFFAASDCPISNRYAPEIQRLAKEFAASGVVVWFVYPNPGDDAKVVRTHNAEYAITARTVLDTDQALTKMGHASTTPEAAILVPDGDHWRQVYRGRVDDRYISFDEQRPKATHHDLEEGIRAVLNHQTVAQAGGPSVGCSIVPLHP
jgi:thiol-disulfide isomerase/thioredoxin